MFMWIRWGAQPYGKSSPGKSPPLHWSSEISSEHTRIRNIRQNERVVFMYLGTYTYISICIHIHTDILICIEQQLVK